MCAKGTVDGPQFAAYLPLVTLQFVVHGSRQRDAHSFSISLNDGVHEF